MKHSLPGRRLRAVPFWLALILAAWATGLAQAHTRVEAGPYVLVVGWVEEPVIVGERNGIFLAVHDANDEPVTGVEAALTMDVRYAGRSYRANLLPTATPGEYTAVILPTVRGQYELHLSGQIGDTPIDLTVQPEEVLTGRVIQFPEAQPEPLEMQQAIDRLAADMAASTRNATILAGAGLVAGLAGLILGLLAWRRRP